MSYQINSHQSGHPTLSPSGELEGGQSRGIRNNNPLNIRCNPRNKWAGMRPVQTDKAFCQFESMEWGLRAALITMRTYRRKHGLKTVTAIILRWAPPSENRTVDYVRTVCTMTGLRPYQPLKERDYSRLVCAMGFIETGQYIPAEEIENVKQKFNIKITENYENKPV